MGVLPWHFTFLTDEVVSVAVTDWSCRPWMPVYSRGRESNCVFDTHNNYIPVATCACHRFHSSRLLIISPPCPLHHIANPILPINESWRTVHSRFCCSQVIVQGYCCFGVYHNPARLWYYRPPEQPPSIHKRVSMSTYITCRRCTIPSSKNAKGIFNNPPSPTQPVVEHSLFHCNNYALMCS